MEGRDLLPELDVEIGEKFVREVRERTFLVRNEVSPVATLSFAEVRDKANTASYPCGVVENKHLVHNV